MPDVKVASVIGEHAITMNEFKQIYTIFAKYKGLEPLRMSHEEQNVWHEKQGVYAEENRKYWESMTFENYCREIKNCLMTAYAGLPADEVPEYIKREREYLKRMYERQRRPNDVAYELFMIW